MEHTGNRPADLIWRKSAASGGGGGDCVEVAFDGQSVLVRDSKNKAGPSLRTSVQAWHTFLSSIKAGDT